MLFLSLWLVGFAFASPLLKHRWLLFAVSLCPLGILLPVLKFQLCGNGSLVV